MGRRRIDFDGAWHHVMNRGARRQRIFTSAADARTFLAIVGDQVERTGLEIHAYALMTNHFHLLVRSPESQLSDFMQHLTSLYTRRFNQRQGVDGPLFRGRFLSKVISSDPYLSAASRYIHRNPLDIDPEAPLDRYRWSSYGAYLGRAEQPEWLSTAELWEFHGGTTESFRTHVEGEPIPVAPTELRGLLAMTAAERHPDPDIDISRIDRSISTALADHLPAPRAAALVADLGYPNSEALRKGRARARQRLAATPVFADIIAHTLTIAA